MPVQARAGLRWLLVGALLGTAGCSSVPDEINPVEWYRGASDWLREEAPPAADERRGTRPAAVAARPAERETSFPSLASVPERPKPTMDPMQRRSAVQALRQDRAAAGEQAARRGTAAAPPVRPVPESADAQPQRSPAAAEPSTSAEPMVSLAPPPRRPEADDASSRALAVPPGLTERAPAATTPVLPPPRRPAEPASAAGAPPAAAAPAPSSVDRAEPAPAPRAATATMTPGTPLAPRPPISPPEPLSPNDRTGALPGAGRTG